MAEEDLITIEEALVRFNVSRGHMRRLINRGDVEAAWAIGACPKKLMIRRADVEKAIKNRQKCEAGNTSRPA